MTHTKKGKSPPKKNKIKEISQQLFRGLEISEIPENYYSPVYEYLKLQKQASIDNDDFLSAQLFDDKIIEMELHKTETTYLINKNGRVDELQRRLFEARQNLEEQKAKKNEVLDNFQRERESKMMKLQEQLDEELNMFDIKHSGEIPAKFRKYSADYLNLKQRELFMVSSKRYVEANALKKEADKKKIIEEENQRKNWDKYVNKQREILIKKQQEKLRCLEERYQKEWNALYPSFLNEIEKSENAIRMLESKIAEFSLVQNVDLDGTATARNLQTRSRDLDSSSRRPNPSLPPLSVRPTQADPLRSRLQYIRKSNYIKKRQKEVQKYKERKSNSSLH